MNMDDIWERVLNHYGIHPFRCPQTFKINRPPDHKIKYLYEQMLRLNMTFHRLYDEKPEEIDKFLRWDWSGRRPPRHED